MKDRLAAGYCLSFLLFAASLSAQVRYAEAERIDLKVDHQKLFAQAGGPSASVTTEKADNALIFAVVGSTAGAGGTFFRSDVTLVNNRSVAQNIAGFYFPAGAGCSNARTATLRMPAFSWVQYNDFVSQFFNSSGLGSVVIFAVNSNGDFDSLGNIDGFSRIWTPISGFSGTASQSFPAVALSSYPSTQYIYGVRHDSAFRTNVFIFNYLPNSTGSTRTFSVFVGSGSGQTASNNLAVTPCSLSTWSLPASNMGVLSIAVTPPDSLGGWYAFGSTVDNLSGDNWSVAARPDAK
jgi:hypothetical protein